jgi:hypothetical protein
MENNTIGIKVTRKGNVKVDGIKYHFVVGGVCEDCAFKGAPACCHAPCTPGAREKVGLPALHGNFMRRSRD